MRKGHSQTSSFSAILAPENYSVAHSQTTRKPIISERHDDIEPHTQPADEPLAASVQRYLNTASQASTEAVDRRHRSRERYEAVFDQASNFIAILEGAEHRFVFANANYLRAVGGRQVVGKTVREALPDGVAQGYLAKLNQVYASGQAMMLKNSPYDVEPVVGGPVTHLILDVVFQPVTDAAGRPCGILIEGNIVDTPMTCDE